MANEVCEFCSIEINPMCDEAHVINAEGEPYLVCDACYLQFLVDGKVPAWV